MLCEEMFDKCSDILITVAIDRSSQEAEIIKREALSQILDWGPLENIQCSDARFCGSRIQSRNRN